MGEHSEVTEDMMQPALTDPLTTTVVTTKDANENNTKSGKWERSHLVTHIFLISLCRVPPPLRQFCRYSALRQEVRTERFYHRSKRRRVLSLVESLSSNYLLMRFERNLHLMELEDKWF